MKSIKLLLALVLSAGVLSACVVVPADPVGYRQHRGHHHHYHRDRDHYRGDHDYRYYRGR
ncbi:MAG: hypothetical protein JNJ60_06725 [Rhodocyclaceae bacterium]|nr:hypothetical protein [Rhodocyclaceae bacterium]